MAESVFTGTSIFFPASMQLADAQRAITLSEGLQLAGVGRAGLRLSDIGLRICRRACQRELSAAAWYFEWHCWLAGVFL